MQLKYSLIGYDPYLAREYVCHGIWGPPYYMGAPRNSLFAYYMRGPLRSVSLGTMLNPSSYQFLRLIYIWGPLCQFLCLLLGPP